MVVVLLCGTYAQQRSQGLVYVAVMDRSGKPVERRPIEAFHVWEDGAAREVVSAARATDPLAVVIVVHGMTREATQDVRRTIRALLDTLRQADSNTRIALTTAVQTPRLLNVTTSAPELDDAVNHFVASDGGIMFFEAVQDASNALAREATTRRAVFIISDTLKSDGAMDSGQQAMSALRAASVSLWAVAVIPDLQRSNAAAMTYERDNALTSWAVASGGFHEAVFGTTSLPTVARRMANVLLSQYAVTFNRPAGAAPGTLRVGVSGAAGERVIAPTWAAK